jgi:cystathionine gamma-synthase
MFAAAPSEDDGHSSPRHARTVAATLAVAHHYGQPMRKKDQSTVAVTAGRPERVPDAPLNPPIVPASAFVAGGPTEYAREGGPTVAAFEEVIAALESQELESSTPDAVASAIAFSSGMAAADAVLDLVPLGGRVIAPTTTYTGVAVRLKELDARGSIRLELVDVTATTTVLEHIGHGADLLWLESPTNPLLEQAELSTLVGAAQAAGIRTVVDNTFATPILQQPLAAGADVVLHSATKALSGHSDLLMGVLVTHNSDLAEALRTRRLLLGAAPSAFDSYLALRGVRTLALRVERAGGTAAVLADNLRAEPAVSRVRHFGSMIAIEFHGDSSSAQRVCEGTRIWVHATSLGGVESTLERRRRWALEAEHVPEDLVRLSVGIEDPGDLWDDLRSAIHEASAR